MAKNKVNKKFKDRKQRWVAIIATVLALAMAFSAIAFYADYLLDRRNNGTGNADQQYDPDAMRNYCLDEIKRLEKYIDDYGPTAAVLSELVQNYSLLIQIEKLSDNVDTEALQGYQGRIKELCHELVELEPENPGYRLQLLYAYHETKEDDAVIAEEISALRELLHKTPDSASSIRLIEFMKISGQPEESISEEIAWLKGHFERLSATAGLDSLDRYCYAVLLGNYLKNTEAAREQLGLILKAEPPESDLYNAAKDYQEMLQQQEAENSSKGKKITLVRVTV